MNHWEQTAWPDIGEKLGNIPAAILPVGATEQHGPHLGSGVDALLAEKLCTAVAEKTGVMMLPLLPYGCSLGHSQHWPGTISLQPKTLIDVVKQIGDWSYTSGVRRFFIVNTHVSNAAPLRCALEMLRSEYDDLMVTLLNSATLSERVREAHFSDGEDWHANDAETSLMMHLVPSMLKEQRLTDADDPDRTQNLVFPHPVNRTSKNGVTGKPSLATEEKGRELFEWMVTDLMALINRGLNEKPPLDISYFSVSQAGQ